MGVALVVPLLLAATPVVVGSSHESDAQAYCAQQGGNVVELKPYLYPDSDQQTELAGSLRVCQFISEDGDSVEQIVVDLDTLYSEKPTLAGLAYLAQVPSSGSGAAGSNPASSYCPDDLAGTEEFGTAASGAWVGDLDPGMEAGTDQPLGDSVTLCVFADRSAIDEFGLFYASQGVVRGIDLTTVMRYQPDGDAPEVYASGS
jgi:putative hemolysin